LDIVLVTPLEPASSIMVLAATILKQIRPQDRVAIVSHGLDPAIELPFTSDRNRIAAAIRGLGGRREAADPLVRTESIAIEYAIRLHADAAQASLPARNARRLVVKLVRPMSYLGSLAHFDDRYGGRLILRLWEADIPLTSVCVPCAGWAPSFIPPEFQTLAARVGDRRQVSQTMDHIARASGGAVVSSSDPKDAEDILTHLRQRYVLWFDQPEGISPGQERKISVELSSEARKRYPDAVVHARQGYVTR
jgi:hypothetical protein